jgi:hypothetical protein
LQIRFCSKAKQSKTKQNKTKKEIHDEKEIKSCHQIVLRKKQ